MPVSDDRGTVERPLVEACVGSVRTAVAALTSGADRLELCAALEVGGTTPSAGTVQVVLAHASVDVRVMVRPRGGDFTYGEAELAAMIHDIDQLRTCPNPQQVGLGIVTGAMNPDGRPDVAALRRLVRAAGDLPVILHKCVDQMIATTLGRTPAGAPRDVGSSLEAIDPLLRRLIDTGLRGVLTSGGAPDAAAGADLVAAMQQRYGDRLEIVLGGGVRAQNVAELAAVTGVPSVHLRAAAPEDDPDTFDPRVLSAVQDALGRVRPAADGHPADPAMPPRP